MIAARSLRLSPLQRRKFISSLFGLTFFATIFTVSASSMLPCPAHIERGRFADGESEEYKGKSRIVIEKRPRRWIEESKPQ
ncbi:hypothetical protein GLOTRDRAFT_55745 [Gloeophyllum trabeum ATCC 11539]|uniref:Uncharacterized protein n=1 Tax=Gloeophyllum trabeum (strain ATCC 11539 / FP-39264 / Madison 617) TaxID=670483 RepID=S7QIY1_GLOTA|nr:uncharacterized protein GLOTRDRAFT_55745 [Gloeophyllum trabeum ATCC 11539]EPQ59601.1 hypothetical protein GLOTRDRAFT_55745 [Gloeophyllum trabeum ATCC 11539]